MFSPVIIVVLTFVGVLSVMSAPIFLSDQEEWEKFKSGFNRNYENSEEEETRFKIFQANLQGIREHNEKYSRGETTFTQGINNFSDLTKEEFKSRHTGYLGKKKADD